MARNKRAQEAEEIKEKETKKEVEELKKAKEEIEKENKEKSKRKARKKKNSLPVIIAILIVIAIILLAPAAFIYSKLSLMEKVDLNEKELAVNQDVDKINEHIEEDITEKQLKQIKNVLLLGSDTRNVNDIGAGRSDTMIILSINPIKNSIKLISIPRDSYVNINGRMDKLNHAYAYGGEELLIKTINSTFNLNITDFVTVDFRNLAKIIDAIGGVEIEIAEEERQFINSGSGSIYKLVGRRYQRVVKTGTVLLDGPQAVTYARDRTHGSDFARQMRQQNIIKAAINKVTTLPMNKIMDLVDITLKQVRTNVNVMEYTPLLTDMLKERDQYMQNIVQTQIPDRSFGVGKKINGIYYFTFNDVEAQKRFAEIIYNQ